MFITEGMGKQRRPRRAFTAEFKAEIVEVCRRGDRSMRQVAKDLWHRMRPVTCNPVHVGAGFIGIATHLSSYREMPKILV
jgi:hypothetical protein